VLPLQRNKIVSESRAQSLQRKGVIEYARGKITILNRQELQHCACECYALMQQEKLKFKADTFLDEAWSRWSMHVHDEEGLELFSFPMADVKNGNGK